MHVRCGRFLKILLVSRITEDAFQESMDPALPIASHASPGLGVPMWTLAPRALRSAQKGATAMLRADTRKKRHARTSVPLGNSARAPGGLKLRPHVLESVHQALTDIYRVRLLSRSAGVAHLENSALRVAKRQRNTDVRACVLLGPTALPRGRHRSIQPAPLAHWELFLKGLVRQFAQHARGPLLLRHQAPVNALRALLERIGQMMPRVNHVPEGISAQHLGPGFEIPANLAPLGPSVRLQASPLPRNAIAAQKGSSRPWKRQAPMQRASPVYEEHTPRVLACQSALPALMAPATVVQA